jgi:uncharacterized membrane protein YgcG
MSSSSLNTVFKTTNGTCQRLTIDSANFTVWQHQVQLLLNGEDLLDIVLGNELCPSIPIGATIPATTGADGAAIAASAAPVNPAALESATLAIEKWQLKSKKAGTMLYNTLSEPVQASIHEHWRDPTKMWTVLNAQYDVTKERGVALRIKAQFFTDKLGENERIEQYIARIVNYRNQLASTNVPLSDNDIVGRFLTALTPAWATYVDKIYLADKDLSFEQVCSTLRSYSTHVHGPEAATAAAAAASSERGGRGGRGGRGKGRGRGRGSSRGRGASTSSAPRPSGIKKGSTVKCWLCNETGHKIPDCPEKKRFEEYKLANGPKREDSGSGSRGTTA